MNKNVWLQAGQLWNGNDSLITLKGLRKNKVIVQIHVQYIIKIVKLGSLNPLHFNISSKPVDIVHQALLQT